MSTKLLAYNNSMPIDIENFIADNLLVRKRIVPWDTGIGSKGPKMASDCDPYDTGDTWLRGVTSILSF